ncbi:MAG: hypothetical protein M1819_002707 [Sarea resinae]|nr:MAG: hypothetical protein M1819_002707 [Sarea resinae]
MAVAGDAPSMGDFGAILGFGGPPRDVEWKWRAPSIPPPFPQVQPSDNVPPALPSWLTDYVPTTDVPPSLPLENTIRGLDSALRKAKGLHLPKPLLDFQARVSRTTDLDGIRSIIAETGLDLRRRPEYSRVCFDHLLEQGKSLDVLADFLSDAGLNNAEAHNLKNLIVRSGRHDLTSVEMESLSKIVKQALIRGTVCDPEIRALLKYFPAAVGGVVGPEQTQHLKTYGLQVVWEGLKSCPVLAPSDLEVDTLELFLFQLSQQPFSDMVRTIGIEIITSASNTQLQMMGDGLSSFIVSWVHGWRDQEAVAKDDAPTPVLIPHLHEMLTLLPDGLAQSTCTATTEKLVEQMRNAGWTKLPRRLLCPWMATVKRSMSTHALQKPEDPWKVIENFLPQHRQYQLAAAYLHETFDVEIGEFIIRHWVPEDKASVAKVFRTLCEESDEDKAFANIALSLRECGKPTEEVMRDTFRLLRFLGRPEAIVRTTRCLVKDGITITPRLLAIEIQHLSNTSPALALQLFLCHSGLRLEGCKELVFSLINDPGSNTPTTFRLLRRQEMLTKKAKTASSCLSVSEIALVHEMALAFAYAPHLTPRMALRQSSKCYWYLQRHRAPIGCDISQALTHAGITRALKSGYKVGWEKINFILDLVRELEGDEVADELDQAVYHWRGRAISESMEERRRYR